MLQKDHSLQEWRFTYLDKTGRICNTKIVPPTSPAKPLAALWEEYDAKIMGVRNIESGKRFKITNSPQAMAEKYNNKVYGYAWDSYYSAYNKKTWEVWYASRHEWVVEWFYRKENA